MTSPQKILSDVKKTINDISPSFCTAKWSQVTLHLHNGRTHSCHHPNTHKVPLEELAANPSALHNTNFKKEQRKMMLSGERPKECQYCWNVEDLPTYSKEEFFSDRVAKSAAAWSMEMFDEVKNNPWDHNINPSYVEVSFSNICNFKCSYCSPVYSSRWTEEMENQGPYPTSQGFNNLDWYKRTGEMPIHHREHNPYVEAFWKWWPELVKSLKIFRITGGEPLLANDTYKVLDFLAENPQPQLELAVNTNACVPDAKIQSFIGKSKKLLEEGKIKNINVFTSVDGHGKQAEYGRFGLDYDKWLININTMLSEIPGSVLTIMSTANIFSITSYMKMLQDLVDLKLKYGAQRLCLDISILRHPHHQCLSILTDEYKNHMDHCLEYMKSMKHNHMTGAGAFLSYEILRMDRLINFIKAPPHQAENISLIGARRDFAIFVDEHDRRRGTNFMGTFPELRGFYEFCKAVPPRMI